MQTAIQVLHGAERGEPAALFLSPLRPSFKNLSGIDMAQHGSQFTFFLTSPLQAFCELVDYNLTNDDMVSELLSSRTLQKLAPLVSKLSCWMICFRTCTTTRKAFFPPPSLNGRRFFVLRLTWTWFGLNFCVIHFFVGLFLGTEFLSQSVLWSSLGEKVGKTIIKGIHSAIKNMISLFLHISTFSSKLLSLRWTSIFIEMKMNWFLQIVVVDFLDDELEWRCPRLSIWHEWINLPLRVWFVNIGNWSMGFGSWVMFGSFKLVTIYAIMFYL